MGKKCEKCKIENKMFVWGYTETFCEHKARQKSGTKRSIMAKRNFLNNAFK